MVCQGNPTTLALNELAIIVGFEFGDPLAHCRLGDGQRGCGLHHRARAGQGDQGFKVLNHRGGHSVQLVDDCIPKRRFFH